LERKLAEDSSDAPWLGAFVNRTTQRRRPYHAALLASYRRLARIGEEERQTEIC
jgi:hypothetical protein